MRTEAPVHVLLIAELFGLALASLQEPFADLACHGCGRVDCKELVVTELRQCPFCTLWWHAHCAKSFCWEPDAVKFLVVSTRSKFCGLRIAN